MLLSFRASIQEPMPVLLWSVLKNHAAIFERVRALTVFRFAPVAVQRPEEAKQCLLLVGSASRWRACRRFDCEFVSAVLQCRSL